MADTLNGLFISELLADNAGGTAVDVDNDGNTNKADEFIELQNSSGAPISLDGYEVWSEKNGLLYSFGPTDTISSGGNATVVGNYTGTPPEGFYDAGISENGNFIPDGEGQKFDSIFLVDSNTGDYVVLSYGNPPRTPTLPTGFTGTNQIGAGETIDSNAPNGTAFARDENGALVETTPTAGTPDIPCFLLGTQIATDKGLICVEDLEPGMKIFTKDAGFETLRAIGRFEPTLRQVFQHPELKPVFFPKGSIGNLEDMLLSQSHRILIECAYADLIFGVTEVFVPANTFVGQNGVQIMTNLNRPVYFHLLLDSHEVISAQGIWTESLFLADVGKSSLEKTDSWRYEDKFDVHSITHKETARMVLKKFESKTLMAEAFSETPDISNSCSSSVQSLAA